MRFCIVILVFAVSLFTSFCTELSESGTLVERPLPKFAFSWLDDKNTFDAGDIATIKIKVLDYIVNGENLLDGYPVNLTISVNGKSGNSSYISGVFSSLGGDCTDWSISFIPITVGLFNVMINDDYFAISDSSLHFLVLPGRMYPSVCVASWTDIVNEFVAGTKAAVMILPKDAFGNNISSISAEPYSYKFMLTALYENGSLASSLNITHVDWNEFGYLVVEFVVTIAGSFKLHIEGENQSLIGSPLPLKVKSGSLDTTNCLAKWNYGTNVLQIFSKLEIFIHQKDQYGNLVPGLYEFDAEVVEKGTNLSIPIADLQFKEVIPGIQLFSFSVLEPGEFVLTIFDMEQNQSISNMPYDYTVFVGYCDELNSVINGSGLAGSIAGKSSNFSVYLNDMYHYPSPVDTATLWVKIMSKVDSSDVLANIYPVQIADGDRPMFTGEYSYGAENVIASNPALFLEPNNNNSTVSVKFQTSIFDVIYTPERSGTYEIQVFCGNIPLNGGHSFLMEVKAGEYFPRVYNDTLSVWEDESIAFDVLENDYFAGDNASIVESSMPRHGSLLKYGRLFRYTPHKGYFGNDSFTYTISDINGNIVSAMVIISVLGIPPQFVSSPIQLKATEDMISPRFGGFPGFEIAYSDLMENISVTLSSQSGTIFLSPMLMQFQDLAWSGLSVNKGGKEGKGLTLVGVVEVINHALQSIQYLGNENFFGEDAIHVSSMNKNGANDAQVVVSVEPINDPPFIHAPEFIMLEEDNNDGLLKRDQFDFLIGDPDLQHFPGNESYFLVTLSLEVNVGILVTSLPVHLINTTELKIKDSHQWQPLQNFVTISKHFLIKGKGIRFRGTIMDCNNVIQQLQYQGGEPGAVLTVTVNDMGNYGCCPDCAEGMSLPLFSEATVNLIRRRPMSSMVAHTMGEIIVVGFVVMFSLGVVLLIFICKCAIALVKERKRCNARKTELLKMEHFQNHTSNATSLDDATYFTACCSSPFLLRSQNSNFRQRSCRQSGTQGSCSNEYCSSQSSGD
ncbi:PREDICTED: protein GAMETE EXPRESSED 2 isoform X3 [Nelumbo nucifera]|uniref:Protein GAMETE EXPRESSED 2 isoform X3 n=1 Tax=Nelumbo nucifera TaxID=4432 RepID=A0A1U8Q687_NELNU|nr:PREDICTED: protein GAMETE EXPRESSED 2 isoform X3 [Nelumbo nucifera]